MGRSLIILVLLGCSAGYGQPVFVPSRAREQKLDAPLYEVEASGSRVPDGPIPHGHWLDVASPVDIDPGEVLVFSVPKTHLDPGVSIRVDFEFEWEKNHRYTRHSSYFSYWDLPSALRDREKEKKLKWVAGPCPAVVIQPPEPVRMPDPPLVIRPAPR
jgi:hypothetical protein